jgi:hypothetical protein
MSQAESRLFLLTQKSNISLVIVRLYSAVSFPSMSVCGGNPRLCRMGNPTLKLSHCWLPRAQKHEILYRVAIRCGHTRAPATLYREVGSVAYWGRLLGPATSLWDSYRLSHKQQIRNPTQTGDKISLLISFFFFLTSSNFFSLLLLFFFQYFILIYSFS